LRVRRFGDGGRRDGLDAFNDAVDVAQPGSRLAAIGWEGIARPDDGGFDADERTAMEQRLTGIAESAALDDVTTLSFRLCGLVAMDLEFDLRAQGAYWFAGRGRASRWTSRSGRAHSRPESTCSSSRARSLPARR
jgi:hypothetical protein